MTRTLRTLAPKWITIVLVAYAILSGLTYDGMLNAGRRLLDVLLVGALALVWLWWRRRWQWQRTPLDWAIVLWGFVLILSLLANLSDWRRIVIGIWFVGLYVGIWLIGYDALANRGIRREWLVDALLITGVPVVFVGFAQVELALTSGMPLPRPVGTLGNANALAAFLVMLIPLTAGRCASSKTPLARVALGVYCFGTLILMLLTFSRGGWLGAVVAVAVWVSLRFPLRRWWSARSRAMQIALTGISIVVILGAVVFVAQSFGIAGRSLDLRAWIYQTALDLFAERPIEGHGLFTFGAGLARLNSMPPYEPHSHAHNVILQVAAELGILGLAALALIGWLIFRAIRRPTDALAIMGTAAFAGFAAHQLVDFPAMMPAIAVPALIALLVAFPPVPAAKSSSRPAKQPRLQWQPLVIAASGLALALGGVWDTLNYRAYVAILSGGIPQSGYRAAAERLQPVVDADPAFPVYGQQQALLFGWAAAAGDAEAGREAIETFRRYTTLAPEYVTGWANLAGLYTQFAEYDQAADAMRRAVELAPQSWSLSYRYGVIAETAGDALAAGQQYTQALKLNPDVVLMLDWDQSELRRATQFAESDLSTIAQTMLHLERGEVETARQFWRASGADAGNWSNVHVVNLLFALIDGDRARAAADYQAARWAITETNARVWTYLGAAFLDSANFDQQIEATRAQVDGTLGTGDWELGANINYIQFLSLAMPRQFLPQVGYTEVEPVLLRLLSDPEALANLRAVVGV